MFKKIVIGLLLVLVIIQFIRPDKNVSAEQITANDVSKTYTIPEDVHQVLITKCYDCHSNNTTYPWYASVQPLGWWLAHHIDEGKGELNFSDFKSYDAKKAAHKLEELVEVVDEDSMPLKSYTLLHPDAKLTADDKENLLRWLRSLPVDFKKGH